MRNILFTLCLSFYSIQSSAQLQADFYCTGCVFDVCCGGFADASTSGGSNIVSWYWDFGNGETSNLQNPVDICYDSIGSYTVCLTVYDANGNSDLECKQSYMTRDISGTQCTPFANIKDLFLPDFKYFPNPTSESISFQTSFNQELEFSLFDNLARFLKREKFTRFLNVDTEFLPSGVYHFTVKSNDGSVYNGEFIKE